MAFKGMGKHTGQSAGAMSCNASMPVSMCDVAAAILLQRICVGRLAQQDTLGALFVV